jgi:hypothetical protein
LNVSPRVSPAESFLSDANLVVSKHLNAIGQMLRDVTDHTYGAPLGVGQRFLGRQHHVIGPFSSVPISTASLASLERSS